MFILLDFDVVNRTLTVIDTTDNVVETLQSDPVFDAIEKKNIHILGIEPLPTGKWQVYRCNIPVPPASKVELPESYRAVTKLHIFKQSDSCQLVARFRNIKDGRPVGNTYSQSYNLQNGIPVNEMKDWYLLQDSLIWLDDEVLDECFEIHGIKGKYAFSGKTPYGIPVANVRGAISFGDFVMSIAMKGLSLFTCGGRY